MSEVKAKKILGNSVWNRLPKEQQDRMSALSENNSANYVRVQAEYWLRRNNRSKDTTASNKEKSTPTYRTNFIPYGQSVAGQYEALKEYRKSKDTSSSNKSGSDKGKLSYQQAKQKALEARSAIIKEIGANGYNSLTKAEKRRLLQGYIDGASIQNVTQAAKSYNDARRSSPVEEVAATPVDTTSVTPPTPPKTTVADTPARTEAQIKKDNTEKTHTIKKGETLGQIAKQYGLDYKALAKANGITNPDMIVAGKTLNLGITNNGSKVKPKSKPAYKVPKSAKKRSTPMRIAPSERDVTSAIIQSLANNSDYVANTTPQPLYTNPTIDDIRRLGNSLGIPY